ncbi:sulfotransferase-like domain-containing protein [Tropicibacter oceani]|uniref:HAD family hydrolase n=1 Tax=Tropicibacter oceani TaxID=3058420 RepID=A0ABY8QKR6_9RHOB|nr:HAD family hydrolase [Tropicibacter oceani]WGW04596.1 HAD family hydrolase [Tropicibacter oceani]
MKIAMWSGPRNLSTALMYSFGNRADFHAVDEPFYGPYLRITGLDHPMRDAVLTSRLESAVEVEQSLLGPIPNGKPNAYHKHMCQHMVDGIPRGFMAGCVNVFLLRHPARVVASFLNGYPQATEDDIGFARQAALFQHCRDLGQNPVVVDSADIRADPQGMLRAMCQAIGLDWDPAMLSWPKGPKPFDGAWAPHWYASVHDSSGFAGPEGALPSLDARGQALTETAMPYFDAMARNALKI